MPGRPMPDRKSTRLNSSHVRTSYAVFCLKKKTEYEEPARRLAERGLSTEDIYWALAIDDIQSAADVMSSVYRLTDGLYGYISLECAPSVANDTQATFDMTADLWRRLDRPNVFIKIPAKPACFFNVAATTEIYTLSLHDALPI